jgi:hypothetical protein
MWNYALPIYLAQQFKICWEQKINFFYLKYSFCRPSDSTPYWHSPYLRSYFYLIEHECSLTCSAAELYQQVTASNTHRSVNWTKLKKRDGLLEKLMIMQLVMNLPTFPWTQNSWMHSQQSPLVDTIRKVTSSPHSVTAFLWIHFKLDWPNGSPMYG